MTGWTDWIGSEDLVVFFLFFVLFFFSFFLFLFSIFFVWFFIKQI